MRNSCVCKEKCRGNYSDKDRGGKSCGDEEEINTVSVAETEIETGTVSATETSFKALRVKLKALRVKLKAFRVKLKALLVDRGSDRDKLYA